MPDSGRTGGSDGPDYGWLYGGQPSSSPPPAGSEDPEPTRMLPRMDRPAPQSSAAARGADGPRTQRPVQPAQSVPPPGKPQKVRRKRPVGKIVLLVLVA